MTGAVPRLVDPCPNPVFVIGSPRSGTSIVPWALAEHPRFWTTRESGFLEHLFSPGVIDQAFAKAEASGWTTATRVDRATFAAHIGLGLNMLLTDRSGGLRWIDQTPANTCVVWELAELFPGARFLHIVRDGRKVVHSMQHFRERLGADLAVTGRLPAWAGEFRDSVRTWRDFVTMSIDFEEHQPARCVRLRLEDAVADPDHAFDRLLEQLGEAPDHGPAAFFNSQRINSSFGDVEGNADAADLARDVDPFLSWTVEEQQVFVEEGALTLLQVLGYQASTTRSPP